MNLLRFLTFALLAVAVLPGCERTTAPLGDGAETETVDRVPGWAADAVFYQIFPERFRNGDPNNDPTRESLEFPDNVPASWRISPWTGDWYARDAWEREKGPDYYENGVFDRRYGGDLQGVLDQLDYLKELGINALYFNPVFYARSLHKYDGNSFHHIDPHFGPDPAGDFALMAQETSDPATWHWTEADKLFLTLIEQAHARDIRVIIDGVFNHTGRGFFAFDDLIRNQQQSPYTDWYMVEQWDDPATPESEFKYKGWWGVETLPEFANTADETDLHPGPKAYVFDATRRWMDPNNDGNPADGIDGWRLDVAEEVPIKFWADWNALVHEVNPQAYTVTEIWNDATEYLREGGFSATMNYHGFAIPVEDFLVDEQITATTFAEQIEERREAYEPGQQRALQNLMDSHDTDRLASMIVNAGRGDYDRDVSPRYVDGYDVRRPNDREWQIQKLITVLQMTYVGAPMIYYGTEAGMWGADDPDDRKPMVWPDLTYADECADPKGRVRTCDPVAFDQDLFDFYQSAIALRHAHPALRYGTYRRLVADDAKKLFGFAREYEGQTYVILVNRSDESQTVAVPELANGGEIIFQTGEATMAPETTIGPLSGVVYRLTSS